MPTTTTNFSLLKPLVADPTDEDLWGGYLNTNFDSIDSLLKVARDSLHRDVTTTDTVISSDRNKTILADATGAAFTITLPTAASAGDGFKVAFVKADASGNAITIDGNGAETINGQANYTLSGQGEAVFLVTDGTAWFSIGARQNPSAVPDATTTTKGIVELATDAETQTGTDSARAVVPSGMRAALGFSKPYNTGQIAIVRGNYGSFSHGFSSTPILVVTELICVNASDTYDVGDILTFSSSQQDGSRGISSWYNSTQIGYAIATSGINIVEKTGGSTTIPVANMINWRIRIRAWA